MRKKPWVAFLFSLFAPPMGQVYNNQYKKAILFFFILITLPILILILKIPKTFKGLFFTFLISFAFYIYIIVDSIVHSRKRKDNQVQRGDSFFIRLVGIIAIFVFEIIIMPILLLDIFATFKTYTTPGNSMKPTLVRGDRFIADMFLFTKYSPRKGDLVLYHPFQGDSKIYVHRCIAIENDTIMISNNFLYLNGVRQIDSYTTGKTSIFRSRFTKTNRVYKIPSKSIFTMGDNRPDSHDSRYLGMIPLSRVLGKALYIYYSKDSSRIGKTLLLKTSLQ